MANASRNDSFHNPSDYRLYSLNTSCIFHCSESFDVFRIGSESAVPNVCVKNALQFFFISGALF